jgi:phage repressor protein C with HTH and peptisase S24 domain
MRAFVVRRRGPVAAVSEATTPFVASNAELVELGTETLWLPLYPARLAAGPNGGEPNDIEPEGAVPLPASFARAQGLGTSRNFSAYVRGDSMRDDLDDGDLVFGIVQEEWDREAVYALYMTGELLVKRVVRQRTGYELVSTNRSYPPIPIITDDVRLIGRVVGSISRL